MKVSVFFIVSMMKFNLKEMYEYDAGDPSDSIGLESQKERSPKKKKIQKKLAQKFKKLKMSKF